MTPEELRLRLDLARVELREAERTCRMLGHAAADPAAPEAFAARLDVEVAVAARRLELWQGVVAKLEQRAAQAPVCLWAHGPVADLDARGLCPACAAQEPACLWAHGPVADLDARGLCPVCAEDEE